MSFCKNSSDQYVAVHTSKNILQICWNYSIGIKLYELSVQKEYDKLIISLANVIMLSLEMIINRMMCIFQIMVPHYIAFALMVMISRIWERMPL
jgi:hypothetical protein